MKILKKGFSLIELLLALAIIVSLSISAFFLYKKLDNDRKTENEIKNVSLIVSESKSLFKTKADYSGWSLNLLLASKSLLDNSVIQKTTVYDGGYEESNTYYMDSWGNQVNIGTVTPGSGIVDVSAISLIYYIPKDACPKFVSSLYPLMTDITVNYSNIKYYGDGDNKLNMSELIEKCNMYQRNASISLQFR